MEQELTEKLRTQYGEDLSPLQRQHLEFALSNRTRGKKVLDTVLKRTRIALGGKRVLDVGSAYGGFVIEAARRGAEAWGVEVAPHLHELGISNARGEPGEIHLVHGDFLSVKTLAALPRDFDLAIVNDVFEHVYDTAALLKQLHALMRPGAPFMFSIPNGDAVSFVAREGHTGTPGITQLPANRWHQVLPVFTAYYRPWSSYSALFRGFGFARIEVWRGKPMSPRQIGKEIADGLDAAKAAVAAMDAKAVRHHLNAAMDEYEARVRADLAIGDADVLRWRYLQPFWKGVAYKTGEVFADIDEKPRATIGHKLVSLAMRVRGLV